jgi:UTP--glucose-1-phosphate uridylyltransferase
MTSFATHARVTQLAERWQTQGLEVHTFPQFISLRLTEKGELFRDSNGKLSPYAPGHGDLVDALKRADALRRLVRSGVRHLFMSNVDNLAATLDPAVIGAHEESGAELTFEVAPLWQGDKGGVPARANGRLQIVEALRYPPNFDERTIPLFSTNSFVFDVAALERDFDLTWFRVTKKVDGRPAIQFERLVNQLAEFVRARGLLVDREGAEGRFLPVKDPAELEARRSEIASVLEARSPHTARE